MSMHLLYKGSKIIFVSQLRIDLTIVFYGIGTAKSPLASLFTYRMYRREIYPFKTHVGDALELWYSCAKSSFFSKITQKYLIDRAAFMNHR
ncbi:MAG: hypothetical protein BWX44_01362 [Spirochaetes bacterium ADurb.Bin001]|nr:MAG: hypothetical protein BWX44_01362 [Spirochaetes bacterium ADurb.Bin001]